MKKEAFLDLNELWGMQVLWWAFFKKAFNCFILIYNVNTIATLSHIFFYCNCAYLHFWYMSAEGGFGYTNVQFLHHHADVMLVILQFEPLL